MDLIEQMNQHKYLFLAEIGEPNDNVLRLVIAEARASDTVEDLQIGDVTIPDTRRIISDDSCSAYEVMFGSYVIYSVRNESYVIEDQTEVFTGRLFREYSASRLRDYVGVATFASDTYPGKLNHYEIVCENHIVDIVSTEKPMVAVIRRAQQLVGPERG